MDKAEHNGKNNQNRGFGYLPSSRRTRRITQTEALIIHAVILPIMRKPNTLIVYVNTYLSLYKDKSAHKKLKKKQRPFAHSKSFPQ